MDVSKNFDAERVAQSNGKKPATFVVGGETFTIREWVSAEVLADFGRREVAHFGDTMDAYDTFIKQCLVEADTEKWDKVRKTADPPLTVGQVETIIWWAMDEVADRPTEASSSSRRGRGARQDT